MAAEGTPPPRHCLTLEPRWKDLISGLPPYPPAERAHLSLKMFPIPMEATPSCRRWCSLYHLPCLIRKDKIRKQPLISLWFCAFFCCCCRCRSARKSFQTRFGEGERGQFSLYGCFFPLINQPSALLPVYHGGDLISIKLLTTAVIISASQFMRL